MNGLTMDDYELTLTTVLERAERLHGAREVVSRAADGEVHRTTYAATIQRARKLAGALADLGVRRGDRVATLLWNQPEHLELYFAVTGMGAVVHTLNPRLHADELTFIVDDAEDKVLVVDATLAGLLDGLAPCASIEHVVVVGDPARPEGTLDYEQLVEAADPIAWPEARERQAAAMCYTSGTTGRPKGVVYSHRALVLHSLAVALPDALGVGGNDTVLPVVPMFHANAWGLPFACAMTGADLVLPGPRLDAVSVLDLLEVEGVTMTAGVPTVWMAVLAAIDAEPRRWDLAALRRMVVGGAAVPPAMIDGFDRHGLEILQAWGMTELSPLGTTCHLPRDLAAAPSAARTAFRARQGRPVPLVEVRVCDDDGGEIAWDDEAIGELQVRGPWVAAGYHGDRGADGFTDDGWFRTGDVVAVDPRGCMRICDRSKDLIKSGGEWISSVDLENALMAHPAVAEAAVIATPDPRWGERPLAVVVLADGADADAEVLRAHLGRDFAKWQLPERFEFIDAIPRTATGKWKKTALRELFVTAVSA
jgi:fatty-acyl-CoA synthase